MSPGFCTLCRSLSHPINRPANVTITKFETSLGVGQHTRGGGQRANKETGREAVGENCTFSHAQKAELNAAVRVTDRHIARRVNRSTV